MNKDEAKKRITEILKDKMEQEDGLGCVIWADLERKLFNVIDGIDTDDEEDS